MPGTLSRREDGRIERHCEHGIGHTVGHVRGWLLDEWEASHGCDGCCAKWPRQKTARAEKPVEKGA